MGSRFKSVKARGELKIQFKKLFDNQFGWPFGRFPLSQFKKYLLRSVLQSLFTKHTVLQSYVFTKHTVLQSLFTKHTVLQSLFTKHTVLQSLFKNIPYCRVYLQNIPYCRVYLQNITYCRVYSQNIPYCRFYLQNIPVTCKSQFLLVTPQHCNKYITIQKLFNLKTWKPSVSSAVYPRFVVYHLTKNL